MSDYILTADVGGTNTQLACFKLEDNQPPQHFLGARFQSKGGNFPSQINQILELAYNQSGVKINRACFAVAGIISADGERSAMGNVDWGVDCRELRDKTPLEELTLINDFQALGFGTNFLDENNEKDLIRLPHPGNRYPSGNPTGTRAIIGAGTGLGHGILVYSQQQKLYFPLHSEGSHCDLAATNDLEWRLVQYLRNNVSLNNHPDYERVASGPGLVNIYNFLCLYETSPSHKIIEKAPDKAAAITENTTNDPTCQQTIQIFLRFYARAAKNLAITCMATGGLYLGGGITPKILPLIQKSAFAQIFEESDRLHHRDALREIPLWIIINPRTALLGAAMWRGNS